jgi:hypothetical protein
LMRPPHQVAAADSTNMRQLRWVQRATMQPLTL